MGRGPLLRLASLALALAFVGWSVAPTALAAPAADEASQILEGLTPAQRVGQLLLVTFQGSTLAPDSQLTALIRDGLLSGVLLSPRNGNFGMLADGTPSIRPLVITLQQSALAALVEPTATAEASGAETEGSTPGIPLLIAAAYEGDGATWSSLAPGYPDTPSEMALGATWDRDLTRQVATGLGRRLDLLGINLLLGPSLDILGDPRLGGPEDLGVRSFGGDPYWVGTLGESFVKGVHAGSAGRVGVVVTHFPGLGASDRPAAQEIATVRRSLDQLQGFELQPFAAVAAQLAGQGAGAADGMLMAHIRYQGLQGNIRDTTRPVSLDAEAFGQLMQAEPLASWRAGGGVMVSDSLGSQAIRRFIDPSGTTFNAPLVARDAFLAGNDLLLLDNFRSSGDPDEWTTIRATLQAFEQRYADDPIFAQRVDEAALRVLQLKLRLYGGSFESEAVTRAVESRDALAQGSDLALRVARVAATLISPTAADLRARLGEGPRSEDRLVFFTDTRRAPGCPGCAPVPGVDPGALQAAVLSLYGSGGGAGQVRSWNLESFTTADLAAYLGKTPPSDPANPIKRGEDVGKALGGADWVVFVVERERPEEFGSGALKLLLNSRPDLITGKKLVVFALNVPYDLDATDISKVDALYALYSRGPEFLDMAARLLFQELPATGASPVSVPAVGYDLIEALSPNPDQVIGLSMSLAGLRAGTPGAEGFRVNDVIRVTTDVILDVNGHAVPDRTPVEFVLGYPGELPSNVEEATADGVASTSLNLSRLGLLTIVARSDPARVSSVVQLNVQEDVAAFVTVIAPTAVPSLTAAPAEDTENPPASTPEPGGGGTAPTRFGGLDTLLIGLMGATGVSYGAYRLGVRQGLQRGGAVRAALLVFVSGLLGYNYVGLHLPGSTAFAQMLGSWAGGGAALAGGLLGLGAWELWLVAGRGAKRD
jgi:beta-N-acetylhexosaminidase